MGEGAERGRVKIGAFGQFVKILTITLSVNRTTCIEDIDEHLFFFLCRLSQTRITAKNIILCDNTY